MTYMAKRTCALLIKNMWILRSILLDLLTLVSRNERLLGNSSEIGDIIFQEYDRMYYYSCVK